MQLKALVLISAASLAVAQTSTTCAAQNILDACIATLQGRINSCGQTDYSCLCSNYSDMLSTCYPNCPNDPGVATVQSQKQQYCSAASVYGTTTVLGTATSQAATSSAGTTTTAVQSGFASGSSSGSATGSAASATGSNGADNVRVAGSWAALAVAGVAALF